MFEELYQGRSYGIFDNAALIDIGERYEFIKWITDIVRDELIKNKNPNECIKAIVKYNDTEMRIIYTTDWYYKMDDYGNLCVYIVMDDDKVDGLKEFIENCIITPVEFKI